MQIMELAPKVRLELAAMAYGRWGKAFDDYKYAKGLTWETAGKFCPKGDWPEFYKAGVELAEKELAVAVEIKEAFCKFSPLIAGS